MYMIYDLSIYLGIIVIVLVILSQAIKILKEYERGVIFRLGRLVGAKGPGLILLIPIVDKMVRVSLRIITMDVPAQEVITKDTVPVKVNAVIYFRVVNPENSVVVVQNFINATSQIAQTTLRSVLGQMELDELLSQREKINQILQKIVDEHTDPWGIKVTAVETKDVELPEGMKRAMAKQAEAERERRAKVIHAEGEYQASEKLVQAAEKINKQPIALQLRYLQTLTEVATEKNSTTLFPIPIDLIKPFLENFNKKENNKK
ncbi:MAG: slipin family protein [Candidatus Caldatribacteriota bacterium]|nr:slipin family protein [Candidatus Caldatribacteriota bacterium]